MSKHIVFERGKARAPKRGEWFEDLRGGIDTASEDFDRCFELQILRRLPDAEVEALEAKLVLAEETYDLREECNKLTARAEAHEANYKDACESLDGLLSMMLSIRPGGPRSGLIASLCRENLALIQADFVALEARAEKAEAERDELLKQRADLIKCVNDSGAQVEALRAKVDETSNSAAYDVGFDAGWTKAMARKESTDDTRARFEHEATLRFLERVDFVEELGGAQVMRYESPKECHVKAKQAADVVFGPAPAPVKVDAPPAPPAEPWTPKVRDEVKIIASTYHATAYTKRLIGTCGPISDVDHEDKVAIVGGYWFAFADLELVRRAEDAAS